MSKEGGYIIVNMEGVNETGENPGLYELLQVAYTSSKPVLISGFTRNGTLIKDFTLMSSMTEIFLNSVMTVSAFLLILRE